MGANMQTTPPSFSGFRRHPQTTFAETTIEPSSFFGKLRNLYWETVLDTQLHQLKKQGSYDAFRLKWHPAYDVRRLKGGMTRTDGIPPSLFWESDVAKWIEAVCYYLSSPENESTPQATTYRRAVDELVDMIVAAQQPDGYLNVYFTVVDPEGRFKNLRDMHEMYNAGHLLEAALAHHAYTKERRFLDVMIKNIACFAKTFGPDPTQLHGYPGHPELELAVLRLYAVTSDACHLSFARYLLEARGVVRDDQDGRSYFPYEARQRGDVTVPHTMDSIDEQEYNQSHLPIHEQMTILGHSVRAFYLTTAAADVGGAFVDDARRLWDDAVGKKMYPTGGFGSEPRWEGFSAYPYFLPSSTAEGGCYAETCASIACMMTTERLLSHSSSASPAPAPAPSGRHRDVLELCLYNAVLGGGSVDGRAFAYANKHATCGEESAERKEWFEVCCCPPNLSRTLGILGGYTWSVSIDERQRVITIVVYLFVSATRKVVVPLGGGVGGTTTTATATVRMETGMPWKGWARWEVEDVPDEWGVRLVIPRPGYAEDYQVSTDHIDVSPGYISVDLKNGHQTTSTSWTMRPHLVSPHPSTRVDTVIVKRGPVVYVAEDVDNASLEAAYPHFEGLGLSEDATFDDDEVRDVGGGVEVVVVRARDGAVWAVRTDEWDGAGELYRVVGRQEGKGRTWHAVEGGLVLVPWAFRANRGGKIHVRVPWLRVAAT